MPLTNPAFKVLLAPKDASDPSQAPTEHFVDVTNGDRLRAELEAGRAGLPPMKDAPLNHTTLWVWAAMVRLGLYDGKSAAFRNGDLLDMEPLKDPVDVDPTQLTTPPDSA